MAVNLDGTAGEMMTTVVQRLRHEGRAEGRKQGPQDGETRFFARLPECRAGPVPDEFAARIAVANTSQIERWLEAVPDAPTCEALSHADKADRAPRPR